MARLGLEREIKDKDIYERTVRRFREAGIQLPTFAQLAEPERIPEGIRKRLADVEPDAPHPLNLFRVHWFNDRTRRGMTSVPEHVVLTEAMTGVKAPIVVALGNRFPMIHAHKVLAAYGCLAPRVVTGQFDPTQHRAIWPSTGNYCRGGVAISKIMGCRGVAILPERMSEERFRWLGGWVQSPSDVIKTPGCESNVKEIYDECNRLDKEPANIIFNQFAEFGNHLVHYAVTGRALEKVYETLRARRASLKAAAFVSATGSAGTIAAGDYLKDRHGARIVAVEALECPTLLYNGFGDHNIQGIGDKHVPFIHNVMNTDIVTALSDRSTDRLNVLFNTPAGREFLAKRRGVPAETIEALEAFGISSICNVLAAVKTAKYLGLGEDEAIFTVATDGAAMYRTEADKTLAKDFGGSFDASAAAATFEREMLGQGPEHLLECNHVDRTRMFNLGYFTWVEQQGVSIEEFQARRTQEYWRGLRSVLPIWDEMIVEFNRRAGAAA